jgi:hypothetical protein
VPQHIQAGAQFSEMISTPGWRSPLWSALPHRPHEGVGNDGKPIYFDSVDNSAYILRKDAHSARNSWVYVDGETFNGVRADIGGDPRQP